MDKISSIIPANARVSTVDMKSSGVARPGTPAFGREVGISHLDPSRQPPNTATVASARLEDQASMRTPAKDKRAEIISQMSDKFFSRKNQMSDDLPEIRAEAREPEMMTAGSLPMQNLNRHQATSFDRAAAGGAIAATSLANDDMDQVSVGQNLDVMA